MTGGPEHTQQQPRRYPQCFGCGDANPIGLRLRYRREGERLVTEFTPGEAHQGWPGIVHGGIIATLLYEVMENLPYHAGKVAMMRGMQTRFRRPALTGERITAAAWLTSGGAWARDAGNGAAHARGRRDCRRGQRGSSGAGGRSYQAIGHSVAA